MSAQEVSSRNTIGTVINLLKGEFPDITISKIRFLEATGLVEPERGAGGHRLFTNEDVELLRTILRVQRDNYLPLKVIKERLAAGTLTEPPKPVAEVVDLREDTDFEDGSVLGAPHDALITEAQLLRSSGITKGMLRDIQEADLVKPDDVGRYYGEAVLICRAAADLAAYSLDSRHWKIFRNAVSQQVGKIEQAVAPYSPADKKKAQDDLLQSMTRLQHWLLIAAVRDS